MSIEPAIVGSDEGDPLSATKRLHAGMVAESQQHRFRPVIFHLLAFAATAAVFVLTRDPVVTLQLGGCVMFVSYLAMGWMEVIRAPTLLSPLSFYCLWQAVGLGASAVIVAQKIAARESLVLGPFVVSPDDIAVGYLLTLFGSVAFHTGVQATRPLALGTRRALLHSARWTARRYSTALAVLWSCGIICRLFGRPDTALGAIIGPLIWAPTAMLCAYGLSGAKESSSPRISWAILALGTVVEFACNLGSFSKAYIMYSFVPVLWVCSFYKVFRWRLLPIGVLLAAFYFLILAPVMVLARNAGPLRDGETTTSRLIDSYVSSDSLSVSETGEQSVEFFRRQFDPLPVGFIYGEVKRYGLRWGETLDYLAYAFVPRLVWPDKPYVTRGAWFTTYLGQAANEVDATSATGQTAIGELYWNFDVVGVGVGMLGLGILVGVLWRLAGQRPFIDPIRMLVFTSTVLLVVDMSEAGSTLVTIVHRLVTFGILTWIWDRSVKRFGERKLSALGVTMSVALRLRAPTVRLRP
jgi:hypothetical protein